MEAGETLQALVQSFESLGNKPCIVAFQRKKKTTWSYAQVAETVQQLASGLVQAGVRPGDYVTLLAKNSPEWLLACLAIIRAGAAVSPLDTQMPVHTLQQVLHDNQSRFIFTTTDYLNRLESLELAQELRPILLDVGSDDSRGWQALRSTATQPLPTVTPADPAALFYTSGTTGTPKGVPLSHRNLAFQLETVVATRLLTDQDRVLMPLPMYHVYPFTVGLFAPLAFRAALVLSSSIAGSHILYAVKEGQATLIIGVPRLYRALYTGIESQVQARGPFAVQLFQRMLSLSIWLRKRLNVQVGKQLFGTVHKQFGEHLRILTSGGSALDPELAWKLEGLGWTMAIGYGLTETSPLLTMNLPDGTVPNLASVGKPLPGVEMRIDTTVRSPEDDSDGAAPAPAAAPDGTPQQGEIVVRSPSVFAGYRNLPDQTAEVFTEDGWFRTGDLGFLDERGHLTISGRASTLIVTEGGKNIQPEPVEEVYQQNQFIKEIGILQHNDRLVALIVPDMDEVTRWRNGDIEWAIREALSKQRQQLASYQRITGHAITHEPLPRTNLGKIRRHVLTERYTQALQGISTGEQASVGPIAIEDMTEQDRTLLDNTNARQVWELVGRRWPDRQLTPDTSPRDLGIDSLGWINLNVEISQQTGIELGEEMTRQIDTIRDLLRAIANAEPAGPATQKLNLEQPEQLLNDEQRQWLHPKGAALDVVSVAVYSLNHALMRSMFRVEAHGLENLPQRGAFVLAPNHASFLDPFVISAALPYSRLREIYWAGSIDLFFTNRFTRLFSRIGQVLPVAGAGTINVQASLGFAASTLNRKRALVWFPEGRLSPNGAIMPFRQGLGIVLHAYPVPVVPVYLDGTFAAMPRTSMLPRPHPVRVTFGVPCDPRQLAEEGEGDYPHARIVHALRERMLQLINHHERISGS
jgi:long-chain acyl-CoA synthetase